MMKKTKTKRKRSPSDANAPFDLKEHYRTSLGPNSRFNKAAEVELWFAICTRHRHIVESLVERMGPDAGEARHKRPVKLVTIESFYRWLDNGGWDKVDTEALEARILAAAEALGAKTHGWSPRGEFAAIWEAGAPYSAFYCIGRRDQHADCAVRKVQAFNDRLTEVLKSHELSLDDLSRPVLFGLDALKADFASCALWGVAGVLPQEGGNGIATVDPGEAGDWLSLLVAAWVSDQDDV